MRRPGIKLILAALLSIGAPACLPAQTNGSTPSFQEVYDLIRQHATGLSDRELNEAAVQGFLTALSPRVTLVTNGSGTNTTVEVQSLAQTRIFDGDIGYLRITDVGNGLADAVSATFRKLNATNKLSGLVIDLRYADGTDYKAAAATADLFTAKNQPLLNWGEGMASSHEKKDALTLPVAALVNHQTAGAAEALAAALRETGSGLILGSRTAGRAMVTEDFPLKNGERLRIGSAPITLGDGTALSAGGIKPDIDVTVREESERAFYADAFLVVPNTNKLANASTNQSDDTNGGPGRVRFNEAELVREHKAGESPEDQTAKRPPEPQVPVVNDPALARALDLLKGLAVVRQSHT